MEKKKQVQKKLTYTEAMIAGLQQHAKEKLKEKNIAMNSIKNLPS